MTEQQGTWIIDLLTKIVANIEAAPRRADMDTVALETARKIEDIFAAGHAGGRTQRLAKVQCEIRAAIASTTGDA